MNIAFLDNLGDDATDSFVLNAGGETFSFQDFDEALVHPKGGAWFRLWLLMVRRRHSVSLSITTTHPAAPAAPTVEAVSGTTDSLSVSWTAPDNTGKPDISSYDLRYRKGTTGDWTNGPQAFT